MAHIVVYASGLCPYCSCAKQLLDDKGAVYEEIRIDKERGMRAEMEARSGSAAVPQIFIDDQRIGGYADLAALDADGRLDSLLG